MKRRQSQSGYVLLAIVGILLVATTAVAVRGMWSVGNASELRSHRASLLALHKAREELVSFALSEDNTPGSMPCPAASAGAASSSCAPESARAPGRFPFAAMNTMRITGAKGECLWYALSPAFRNSLSTGARSISNPNQAPINPSNRGTLILHRTPQDTGTRAIAILFDPAMTPANATVHSSGCHNGTAGDFLSVSSSHDAQTGDTHFYLGEQDAALAITAEDLYPRLARHVLFSLSRMHNYAIDLASGGSMPLDDFRSQNSEFDTTVLQTQAPLNESCLTSSGDKPPDKSVESWLCFNRWYSYITAMANSSVALTLDTAPASGQNTRCELQTTPSDTRLHCQPYKES